MLDDAVLINPMWRIESSNLVTLILNPKTWIYSVGKDFLASRVGVFSHGIKVPSNPDKWRGRPMIKNGPRRTMISQDTTFGSWRSTTGSNSVTGQKIWFFPGIYDEIYWDIHGDIMRYINIHNIYIYVSISYTVHFKPCPNCVCVRFLVFNMAIVRGNILWPVDGMDALFSDNVNCVVNISWLVKTNMEVTPLPTMQHDIFWDIVGCITINIWCTALFQNGMYQWIWG